MPMTTLTPVDAFSEPVQVEANGTTITKEGIGDLGLQRLANQATFLRNRTPGADASVPIIWNPTAGAPDVSAEWGIAVGGVLLQILVGTTPRSFNWTPPPKGTLTRIDAVVFGSYSSGVHGGLPGTMPTIHGYAHDAATAVVTDLGGAGDASGDVPTYEAVHLISITGLTQDLDGKVINVVVTGEDGANALNDSFAIIAMRFWVTP